MSADTRPAPRTETGATDAPDGTPLPWPTEDLRLLMQSTLANLSQGVIVVGPDQRVVLFNEQVCQLLRLPADWLRQRPLFRDVLAAQRDRGDFGPDLKNLPPAMRQYARTLDERLLSTTEARYLRELGDGRCIEVVRRTMPSGYLVRTYADITDYVRTGERLAQALRERDAQLESARQARRRADEALARMAHAEAAMEQLHALLQTSVASMAQGLAVVDRDGRVQLYNERFLEMLELPESLLRGSPLFSDVVRFQLQRGDLDGAVRETTEAYLARVDTQGESPSSKAAPWVDADLMGMLEDEDAGARRIVSLSAGDGPADRVHYIRRLHTNRYVEVVAKPLPEGGWVRTYTDVTDFVTASRRLADSLSRLRETEARLQQELQRSRHDMDVHTRFVAAVSHEIRTALNGITGMSDLLLHSRLDDGQHSLLQDLRASAAQLRRLTDDILDLAQVQDAGFVLQRAPFDLQATVRQCVQGAQPSAQAKGLELGLVVDGPAIRLHGDGQRIAQVVNNLLYNALKFTDRGSVRVEVRTVAQTDPQAPVDVCISVADTGRGIPPELLAWIFEPFHQGPDSTNRDFGGTGLGLPLSRQLCQAMGGEITVSSRPGAGSVFSVRLPLARADGRSSGDAPAADAAETAPCLPAATRVLVVDDNRINRRLVCSWLHRAGALTEIAEDGAEGLQKVRAADYDCVLMDVSMPVMNGLEATRAIRALARSGDAKEAARAWVPIIGVSAMARPEDRQASLQAGMDAHLGKPLERHALLRTMRQTIDAGAWLRARSTDATQVDTASPERV